MAVGPNELSKLTDEEKVLIDHLEKDLDERLRQKVARSGMSDTIVIVPAIDFVYNARIFEELKKRYITAGWKDVRIRSSSRDGTWLEFMV